MVTNVKYIIEFDSYDSKTEVCYISSLYAFYKGEFFTTKRTWSVGFKTYEEAIDIAASIVESEDDIYGYRIYKLIEVIERMD